MAEPMVTDNELAARLEWWEQHLRGVPTLQLPTDYPRPPSAKARCQRTPH